MSMFNFLLTPSPLPAAGCVQTTAEIEALWEFPIHPPFLAMADWIQSGAVVETAKDHGIQYVLLQIIFFIKW